MAQFRWGSRSKKHLLECHPALQRLADAALQRSPWDLVITDGGRTLAEQRALVEAGASRTLRSRHRLAIPEPRAAPCSHALDFAVLVDNRVRWEFPLYETVWRQAWRPAARDLGITVTWGGSWQSRDGPHIQLSWAVYPATYVE